MPAKKKMTKESIIESYMDFVLEHGHKPNSVYAFAKQNNFEESAFYQFFGSFEAIEKEIFKAFFDNTMKVLVENEEFMNYEPREKLLSFYFTFFENLTANRSYVMQALDKDKGKMKTMTVLADLKHEFGRFIDSLEIETFDLQEENLMKAQKATLRNSAWIQLLVTMKFWMEDGSKSFEKTDIFIEKSVNTSFELLNTKPIKSLIDFGKFIVKENLNIKS
jgi:hypothetical protein